MITNKDKKKVLSMLAHDIRMSWRWNFDPRFNMMLKLSQEIGLHEIHQWLLENKENISECGQWLRDADEFIEIYEYTDDNGMKEINDEAKKLYGPLFINDYYQDLMGLDYERCV